MSALRTSLLALSVLLLIGPASAEQYIESQGQRLVAFDVPWLDYIGDRDGKVRRVFFKQEVGEGSLKLSVKIQRWIGVDKAESEYRDDRNAKRNSQTARLKDPVEIPGADKVLLYASTSPYYAQVVVLYTDDFRCELMLTGTGEAEEKLGETYDRLLETLRVLPLQERRLDSTSS